MSMEQAATLPVHDLLATLEGWRTEPSANTAELVAGSLRRILEAYGARGAYVQIDASRLPALELGVGTMSDRPGDDGPRPLFVETSLAGVPQKIASLWLDVPPETISVISDAVSLALEATWSRNEAQATRHQLHALDEAVRGIASIGSVEDVLQHIVDRVRELVAAQYAALGIVGPFGDLQQFITSGVTEEQRAAIGPLPRGHGVLGFIIQEDASFLIDDIATDQRRFGLPPNHPEMHSFLGTPVRSQGRSIGNLYLTNKLTARRFSADDLELVERFALHAGIAMENARLHEEIQRLAIVEERQRISQDLHDSIIQSLYATSLSLEDLPEIIAEDPAEGAARADRAVDAIHGTIRDIRNFIMGLQPELLEDADLGSGIETLAAEFRVNTMIDLEVRIRSERVPVETMQATHLLAMTREGLSNVARHSGATRASVELTQDDGWLRLTITDNGGGFEPDQPRSANQRGLSNLRARAAAIGGTLTITSEPGVGTSIAAEIPPGVEGD